MARRLVTAEPLGRRALEAARSDFATVAAAQAHGIGVGSLSNARTLLKRGVPELIDLVESGALRVEPAASVARAHGQKRQMSIAEKGPGAVRQEARRLRLRNGTRSTGTADNAGADLTEPIACQGHAGKNGECEPAAFLLADGKPYCSLACLLRAVEAGTAPGDPTIRIVNSKGDGAGLLRAFDVDLGAQRDGG